jgi:hypothetical protein
MSAGFLEWFSEEARRLYGEVIQYNNCGIKCFEGRLKKCHAEMATGHTLVVGKYMNG